MSFPKSPSSPSSPSPSTPPTSSTSCSTPTPRYTLKATPQEVASAGAEEVIAAAREAIAAKGSFLLVLAGGSTPKAMHQELVSRHAKAVDWMKVHFFFGDERCVPLTHESSNKRMAFETLLTPLGIPPVHIHPIPTHTGSHAAAEEYEGTIKVTFSSLQATCFDMVLLGMGADGHTLSLFPGQGGVEEQTRLCIPAIAPAPYAIPERITLTLPAILSAKQRLLLVTGSDKKYTLLAALEAQSTLPISLAKPTMIITDIAK